MHTSVPRRLRLGLFGPACLAALIVCATPVEGRLAAPAPDAADEAARAAFRDLLQQTEAATRRHDLAAKPEWIDTQARWERLAHGGSRLARQLRRCAVPLQAARARIARAHRLFTAARQRTDDTFALIVRHKRLLAQASTQVRRARGCFDRVLRRVTHATR